MAKAMQALGKILPALYLLLNAVVYCVLAYLFLRQPLPWFDRLGIVLRDPVGYTELRTMYAGIMGTLGVFLLLSVLWRGLRLSGLLLTLISYLLLASVRAWGIFVLEQSNALILQLFWIEVGGFLLAILALAAQRQQDSLPKNPYRL